MPHVLIVDDQPVFRYHLCQLLVYAGFEVVGEVGDIPGAEKLIQSIEPQPDIAVVDVMLPGINGVEGVLRLKTLLPSLRVYLVSAYRDQAQVYQLSAEKVGAEAFIAKDDLDFDTVRKWMS